ncbi:MULTISPECIES: hypothetical protein [unclassified Coleofasciculus]|uniref:hypothetical protein n=1 Tax=unclassified Coleofasciculus TaxID=2692782 RepID=UPI00187E8D94|nr:MULTISPECIES: hypothetical protein [unclassified Coleofasciculus]MBE9126985.1 hypothetical protein [Coleofasciculus sp. LEGE 07081]MBE9150332.1 hypothetical protein [Coleofasciculus sp. LEGE 07092]
MDYTEFEFILPKGLVDRSGDIHRQGMMRLATGNDEILVQKDPRVRADPYYRILVNLSQVITHLGTLSSVTPQLLEQLFLIDLVYLQGFLNHINQQNGRLSPQGEF